MDANNNEDISQSARYRFEKANRTADIPAYIQFKSEYEVCFISFRTILTVPE